MCHNVKEFLQVEHIEVTSDVFLVYFKKIKGDFIEDIAKIVNPNFCFESQRKIKDAASQK